MRTKREQVLCRARGLGSPSFSLPLGEPSPSFGPAGSSLGFLSAAAQEADQDGPLPPGPAGTPETLPPGGPSPLTFVLSLGAPALGIAVGLRNAPLVIAVVPTALPLVLVGGLEKRRQERVPHASLGPKTSPPPHCLIGLELWGGREGGRAVCVPTFLLLPPPQKSRKLESLQVFPSWLKPPLLSLLRGGGSPGTHQVISPPPKMSPRLAGLPLLVYTVLT